MSNSYETIIVYSLAKGEEAAKELHAKFEAMIAANGTVDSVDEWGKRKLAYLIDDEAEGFYVFYTFTAAAEFPAELERVAGITEGVLRIMTTKK